MRKGLWTLAVAAALLGGSTPLAASDEGKAKRRVNVVFWPAADIKWEKGSAPGTQVAKLWGDMDKGGPYGVLIRFDKGVVHGLHYHTHTLKIVILSGTYVYRPIRGEETMVGPGSYVLEPGGKKHGSGASQDGPCEIFMTSDNKFDMHMVVMDVKK